MAELLRVGGSPRLDGGITVREAVRCAERWWDKFGRHMMKKVANKERGQDKFRGGDGKAPAIFVRGSEIDVIPSGILRGLPWDQLDAGERSRVAQNWYTEIFLKAEHDASN